MEEREEILVLCQPIVLLFIFRIWNVSRREIYKQKFWFKRSFKIHYAKMCINRL